jgi:hypothetical protein
MNKNELIASIAAATGLTKTKLFRTKKRFFFFNPANKTVINRIFKTFYRQTANFPQISATLKTRSGRRFPVPFSSWFPSDMRQRKLPELSGSFFSGDDAFIF